jgi:dihydroneopterin aldolase
MGRIKITDLETHLHVGVTDEERATPQRILLTVEMEFDFTSAAISDRLTKTIDYYAVAQRLLKFGAGRSWRLIEKLANDVADEVLSTFQPEATLVEVKKFPIPQAQHVSVSLVKARSGATIKKAVWNIR